MKSRKGFTLVELMVVVLIVGILAAVAIPIMRGRIDSAKWSEGKAMMGSIATSIRAWCAEKGPDYTGTTPTTLAQLGFEDGDLNGTYFQDEDFSFAVTATTPPTFTVTCTGGSGSNPPATPENGYVLTGASDGSMSWAEGSGS